MFSWPPATTISASPQAIDWNSAIREAARSPRGGAGGRVGGETGFAESGPISFETQWYDWGPYAAAMVAKIRLHWYQNMPEIIRLGLKGVVIIRFTIQRDGRITDITTLQSSGVPPFDFAAAKAIELASPLSPLPSDFPEPDERVTAAFYYNLEPPGR
jgi:TonB family protein